MKKICILAVGIMIVNFNAIVSAQTYTKEQRIYWLSSIWKDVSEKFCEPLKLKEMNWDSLYISYIKQVTEIENDIEYYMLLKKFMAQLEDGHTEFVCDGYIFQNANFYDWLPIEIRIIEGKFYVFGTTKTLSNEIPIGSEILKMGNISVSDFINTHGTSFSSGNTKQYRNIRSVGYATLGKKGDSLHIQIKTPENNLKEVYLTYYLANSKNNESIRLSQSKGASYYATIIPNNIGYIVQDGFNKTFTLDSLRVNKKRFEKSQYIIVDLRNNAGGNELIADSLLMCFLNIDTLQTYKSLTRKDNGFYSAMGYGYAEYKNYYEGLVMDTIPEDIIIKNNLPLFEQPLVVLISEKTCSAAEDFLITLKLHYPNRALLIGTPTAGSTGAPFVRELPNHNIFYRICTRKPLLPKGMFENGIQPDYYYEKTLQEYVHKEDNILKFTDSIMKKQNIKN